MAENNNHNSTRRRNYRLLTHAHTYFKQAEQSKQESADLYRRAMELLEEALQNEDKSIRKEDDG